MELSLDAATNWIRHKIQGTKENPLLIKLPGDRSHRDEISALSNKILGSKDQTSILASLMALPPDQPIVFQAQSPAEAQDYYLALHNSLAILETRARNLQAVKTDSDQKLMAFLKDRMIPLYEAQFPEFRSLVAKPSQPQQPAA